MDLLNFYKDQYYFEIQRSERFDARLQAPIAVLVLLVGFLAFLFKGVNFQGEPLGVSIFCLIYFLAIVLTVISIVFLKLSWGGSKYEFIPLATTLEQYRKSLLEYYEEGNDGINTNEMYKSSLIEYYIKCSSFNSDVNDDRARKLYLGVLSMSGGAVLAMCSYLPYFSYDLEKTISSEKVEIVTPIIVKESK